MKMSKETFVGQRTLGNMTSRFVILLHKHQELLTFPCWHLLKCFSEMC